MSFKRKKWIAVALVVVLLSGTWGWCVYDINHRLPNPKHIAYSSQNPPNINGAYIVPVKNNLYNAGEFKNTFPEYKQYNEASTESNDMFVVYELEITNTISDYICFKSIECEAFDSVSCWSNGCTVIEEEMATVIIEPEKTVTLHLVSRIVEGDYLSERQRSNFDKKNFGLAISYYPEYITLMFNQ